MLKGLDNPFFQTMQDGVNDAASANNVKVEVQAATSITDTTGQADKLAALANQNYNCFIVNPIDGTNLIQGIAKLAAAKKDDRQHRLPGRRRRGQAGQRNPGHLHRHRQRGGRQAGRRARCCKLLPSGGKVVAIGGISGDVTSAARIDGFTRRPSRPNLRSRSLAHRGRELGSAGGSHPGDHVTARQPRSGRILRRQRRHGPRRGPRCRDRPTRPAP